MLSICIVNWNTREYLRGCLASLHDHAPDEPMEVIVVDNASGDSSAAMVAAEFPQVLLIANTDNAGYADGNNQALSRASGDVLLLLNPDVVAHKDTLARSLAFLRSHPDCGALGCRLIGSDGETQRSVRGFPDPGPVLWEYLGLSRLFPRSQVFGAYRMSWFDYAQAAPVDQPMGTFLMIPRRALTQVGLMDPQFPIFFNEVDWCWRAKRGCGWQIWYTPDATLTHYGGGSTRQVKPAMVRESHRSLLRFYEKHYRRGLFPPLFWMIRAAIFLNEKRVRLPC